jgi:hypothetical protein
MLKKLAVPFLTLALATFGCSSSSTPTPGTGGSGGASAGGKGGGAAGTTGTAGSSAAGTTGTAGSSAAGTTGTAGSSAAGTTGAAGSSAAGHSGGGAGGAKADAGTSMADCTVTDSAGTDVLTAAIFCAQMAAYCPSQFTTESACEDTYTHSGQEHCRSYHMCWGVEGLSMDGGKGNPTVHCPHTIGKNLCIAVDASTGN